MICMLKYIVLVFIFGVSFFAYSSVIFQEGNPRPQMSGVYQLNFDHKDIVKLSDTENKYMTKSKNGKDILLNFMKGKGYEFTEQMGSGYLFKLSTGGGAVATHRYYSRYYSIWKITENSQASEINIADESA